MATSLLQHTPGACMPADGATPVLHNSGTNQAPLLAPVQTWTDANIDNCGACGNNCTQPPNAVRNTCARGFCSTTFFCLLGFGNCNDDTTDGCEVRHVAAGMDAAS
jgi:hypothetical protein